MKEEITVMNVRQIPRDYAKLEIVNYIKSVGNRKVYNSEVVEELSLDMELVENIMEEIENEL